MNKFSNISEYTVSQLNKSIKNIIEGNFRIIKVLGELTQVKKHSSGHIYFTLKDEESSLSGVCWRSNVQNLKVDIVDGQFVLVKGKITTYSPQSKYQLVVDQLEYQGEGILLKMLDERKKQLSAEGLFDLDKKKKIPKIPKNIGVITSETGAVFRDIIHRIKDRFPTNLVLFPAKVQGEGSLWEICAGIDFFNDLSSNEKNKPDVIILARGGGSLEDLMTFNEEQLVRKIYDSKTPIISAIGHETDVTLSDFVSDLRAPTPSAAAELVVPDRNQILLRISDKFLGIEKNTINLFKNKFNTLKVLEAKIIDPKNLINSNFQSLDLITQKLISFLGNILAYKKNKLLELSKNFDLTKIFDLISICSERLSSKVEKVNSQLKFYFQNKKINLNSKIKQLNILSYKETLKRGFAVVRKNKDVITNDNQLKINDKFQIEFYKNKTNVKKIS
ncbi:MAG: exodeoxyribonuclease VII large subunit [Pseudomonadota bacterium]|nr:exodeoxyribonuclease VII large subunit [Pseudomonadota bacterium]